MSRKELQELIGTMEHEELLNKFNAHLGEYAKHREYIARARSQSGKFNPAVIERVVLDHEIKSSQIADDVLPLVPELESAIAGIDAEVAGIEKNKASADEQMEELQLRQAIGELGGAEFDELSRELRETLDKANHRLDELQGERGQLSGALDRWIELAADAGQVPGTSAEAALEPEPEPEPDLPVDVDEGIDTSNTPIHEDVSPVFGEDAVASVDEAIEAGEEVDFGFDEDAGDVGIIEGAESDGEVDLNLVAGGGGAQEGDEIGIDIEGAIGEAEEAPAVEEPEAEEEEPRRALLLYQEGTAEEQIYPFHGEVLTVGRGRDNDIQIKNDSKVSRFHCKLFRRGSNFYIEDNKSSNGTLVNGELITERRLFGGEEVIIGETFFRFRIM